MKNALEVIDRLNNTENYISILGNRIVPITQSEKQKFKTGIVYGTSGTTTSTLASIL